MRLVRAGERKTRIMYGANLSYSMLTRYLGMLTERGYIAQQGDKYVLTDRGRSVMADLERIQRQFSSEIPSSSPASWTSL
jgi:predicted transcriptional regulator